jgi:ATP-dependent Lhr-like helicase
MPSDSMPLDLFTPPVRDWFAQTFAAPTSAQTQAWPAIAGGEHVLISAPTGSGKTLAAFLWGLDRFVAEPPPADLRRRRTRLVYVSPLKALGYDVERNLRAPLRGIGADVRVGIRTGDTPQAERRSMLRHPPDILITTPESLYLMLTSQAARLFEGTEWVIVDEIHAVARTKRGAHLAVTLERLVEAAGRDVQRIGLSATQKPLDEVGRFLVGPQRRCRVVDTGVRKPLDLRIHVPVQSMVDPEHVDLELDQATGKEATRRSIWPAMYPELLELVRRHRTTLIFVNNRRAAERLALRLNELAERERGEQAPAGEAPDGGSWNGPIARAHHGSLAREERLLVEDQLKAGQLPCLVATSSLELGIDMGAVDLVIQIESPKSVTAGLQRIGRAGHGVGDTSRGRIFPKFRADLLECAVVARRMREGLIETTVIPRNPLDVLAQQIVAMAAVAGQATPPAAAAADVAEPAAGDGSEAVDGPLSVAGSGSGVPSGLQGALAVDDVFALMRRTYTFAELERRQLENVLDMLDGRYPSADFSELRPRIVWDRVGGTIRARSGARALAVANAGTIPDRGLFSVNLPDGRKVGELDEEMVYEARLGQTFLLGASAWRIEEIGRDRVVVSPAPGARAAVPFWHGEGVGRPRELGEAIGAFARWAVDQDEATLEREYDLDARAARDLLDYLHEQQEATRVLPSDRAVVVERFRDDIGDWRLCVLSPYGGRVHAAWGLALSARIRDVFGLEADAIWSDDGIIVHLPDADEPPGAELVLVEPEEAEDLVVGELGGSALFGARFRENAGRALLIPRARPGRRTPLWQQRLKSQSLLEVARRYGDFPIVLETYRECLRDVLDVPGLTELLRRLRDGDLSLVEVETAVASPFASSLLFDYIATYMYEGDTPNAERRAAALSLDSDLLRELLGQEELRELIDPDALREVEADLQRRSPRLRARSADELHDVLRQLGDLTVAEAAERIAVDDRGAAAAWLARLGDERRAVALCIGGGERWIAAEDAGLYRDALGARAPSAADLPTPFLAEVPDALDRLARRWARTHGPFESADLRGCYGIDLTPILAGLETAGELVCGELRPGGTQREWCTPEVLRRLRRVSLAALRREIEPADHRQYARFAASWHGVDRPAPGSLDRLREVLVPLQGLPLTPHVWEHDVLPARLQSYSPAWLDALCASGEVVWAGAGAVGRRDGRVALYFRDDARLLGPPPGSVLLASHGGSAAEGADLAAAGAAGLKPADAAGLTGTGAAALAAAIRARLRQGACFYADLLVDLPRVDGEMLRRVLWDLVWAGEVTNDAFAPLRSPPDTSSRARVGSPTGPSARHRFARRRTGLSPQVQGRWSLSEALLALPSGETPARRRAWAELLLERHGIVTRELLRAEGIPGGMADHYEAFSDLETLGRARRGYFVEGLGGAQFALPGAVERLRSLRDPESRQVVVLAATDPAQVYGAALRWPVRATAMVRVAAPQPQPAAAPQPSAGTGSRAAGGPGRAAARHAGASVVLVSGAAIVYVERGGRSLELLDDDDERIATGLRSLAAAVRDGRIGRLSLERIDGREIVGSPYAERLTALGFRAGPRRFTLRKGR